MTLLEMSFTGAVLTGVVALLRLFFINRLPKKTFIVLWGVVVLRLLVPFQITSSYSIYSLFPMERLAESMQKSSVVGTEGKTLNDGEGNPADHVMGNTVNGAADNEINDAADSAVGNAAGNAINGGKDASLQGGKDRTADGIHIGFGSLYDGVFGDARLRRSIWGFGVLLCALWFGAAYFKCRRGFAVSFPVENRYVTDWLARHGLRHSIQVRWTGGIRTPLTYGILRPIILLPKRMDWENQAQLEYVLTHEYVHIRRLDGVTKFVLVLTLCIHWFNPFVWLMYVLCNRDLELSCDERVVRIFGEQSRRGYARTLISLEERKSGLRPLYNSFSQNAIEERITAIMKIKKLTAIAVIAAVLLVAGVAVVFATSGERTVEAGADPAQKDNEQIQNIRLPQSESETQGMNQPQETEDSQEIPTETALTEEEKQHQAWLQQLPDVPLTLMMEGLPEETAAKQMTGNGYTILFPAEEDGWYIAGPGELNNTHNEAVRLWIEWFDPSVDLAGAKSALQEQGFTSVENMAYDMQRVQTVEGVNRNQRVCLVEDVYRVYAVYYSFPDVPEMEEGFGTRLQAYADTFTLNTQNLTPDGEALKEAAIGFAEAYFAEDTEKCKSYISETASSDMSGIEEVLRGEFYLTGSRPQRLVLGETGEIQEGEAVSVEIECIAPVEGEGNNYLELSFVKENGKFMLVSQGWEM